MRPCMVRGLVVGGWVSGWIKGLEGFEPKGSLDAACFLGIGDDGLSHRCERAVWAQAEQ